jgi:hypothetical protein
VVVLQTCEPEASRLRSIFMRGVIALAGLIAITVASCNRAQSVMQSAALPENASEPPVTADDPATTGSVAQAPDQTVACTQQVAGQIVQVQQTLQASNDPCVVYWRSLEVRRHPERAPYLECNGLKAYPDPQPKGHPISLAECDRKLRERQARMAVPVTGMSEEDKAKYRATWGGGS